MKKIKFLVLGVAIISMAISLCACGGKNQGNNETTSKKETTTVQPTTEEPTTVKVEGTTYTIKVVDEAGNPIAKAAVQICFESCYPTKTDDNGVATFNVEEAKYKASFLVLPSGYEYTSDVTEFYFEDGKTDMTITLKKVAQ